MTMPGHSSSRATHSKTHRTTHLQDYFVDYVGKPSTPSPRHEVSWVSSHTSLLQVLEQSSPSSRLRQQIIKTAKKQSETAKQQSVTAMHETVLLGKIILRSTPQPSSQSSRAASQQPSPCVRSLRSVGRAQPSPTECFHAQILERSQHSALPLQPCLSCLILGQTPNGAHHYNTQYNIPASLNVSFC